MQSDMLAAVHAMSQVCACVCVRVSMYECMYVCIYTCASVCVYRLFMTPLTLSLLIKTLSCLCLRS
jgi:hypothetical protein